VNGAIEMDTLSSLSHDTDSEVAMVCSDSFNSLMWQFPTLFLLLQLYSMFAYGIIIHTPFVLQVSCIFEFLELARTIL
jgi:hypothetical protein